MDYTSLIPPPNSSKPRFSAMVDLVCNQGFGAISAVAASLQTLFDVDVAAGEQLDFIGLWVGQSRRLTVPLDVFFSWDTDLLGWNQGQWKGAHQSGTMSISLDDDTYRSLLKATILANHWDGTLVQYQKILEAFLPNNSIFAVDNQDMTMSIYVSGPPLTPLQQTIFNSGPLSRLKPAGVGVGALTELSFGFSEANSSSGFDQGVFGA